MNAKVQKIHRSVIQGKGEWHIIAEHGEILSKIFWKRHFSFGIPIFRHQWTTDQGIEFVQQSKLPHKVAVLEHGVDIGNFDFKFFQGDTGKVTLSKTAYDFFVDYSTYHWMGLTVKLRDERQGIIVTVHNNTLRGINNAQIEYFPNTSVKVLLLAIFVFHYVCLARNY